MRKVEEIKKIYDNQDEEPREEVVIKFIPDENKCFQNKKTGHKFIHSKTGKGLPIQVKNENEINLYNEVNL